MALLNQVDWLFSLAYASDMLDDINVDKEVQKKIYTQRVAYVWLQQDARKKLWTAVQM